MMIFGPIDDQRLVVIGGHAGEQIFFLLVDDIFFVHGVPSSDVPLDWFAHNPTNLPGEPSEPKAMRP
jgi:hypothetical protein